MSAIWEQLGTVTSVLAGGGAINQIARSPRGWGIAAGLLTLREDKVFSMHAHVPWEHKAPNRAPGALVAGSIAAWHSFAATAPYGA